MRVISGSARGTKLSSIENLGTRPTLDRVKESLFNIIRDNIHENCVALDLFAGSGAIGIEMLSRGAKKAVFSDLSQDAINMVKQNLKKTHLENKAKLINKDYQKALEELQKSNEKFDIVFLDPPYQDNIAVDAVKAIEKFDLLKTDGIIIIETDNEIRDTEEFKKANTKLKIYDMRKYGRATLIFLRWKE